MLTQDVVQATMVATWLTELYLDQINRALLEEGPDQAPSSPTRAESPTAREAPAPENGSLENPLVRALTKRLREFLAKHVGVLDTRTTVSLLASYGRLDDLLHYATLRQVYIPHPDALQAAARVAVVCCGIHHRNTVSVNHGIACCFGQDSCIK